MNQTRVSNAKVAVAMADLRHGDFFSFKEGGLVYKLGYQSIHKYGRQTAVFLECEYSEGFKVNITLPKEQADNTRVYLIYMPL